MERIIKSGSGWRIGYNPAATRTYPALLGGDYWGCELTLAEFKDFIRLVNDLMEMLERMSMELMEEERIVCEAETDLVWVEVEGLADSFSLSFIVKSGRGVEGQWSDEITKEVVWELKYDSQINLLL